MTEIKPVYQRSSCGVEWAEITFDFYSRYAGADGFCYRILYPAAAYEALQKNCAKLLDEQDREYNKKTNELINRHATQVEALQKELTHWKANHADLKERLHVATSRTDLPSDRLPLFDQMRKQITELQEALDNLAPYDEETSEPRRTEIMTNSVIEDRGLVQKMLANVLELELLNDAVGHTPSRREIDSHIADIRKVLRR